MPSAASGIIQGAGSPCLIPPRTPEDPRDLVSCIPPVREAGEVEGLAEHLLSIHHYRAPRGRCNSELLLNADDLRQQVAPSERVDLRVGMASFYVMSLLHPDYQSTPLAELAQGQSVGINARSLSDDLFVIQPEVLVDARAGCVYPLPGLERAVGEVVKKGFANRFLPTYTKNGATALFVGLLTHRWNVNMFNPSTTHLLGVNVYARITPGNEPTYCSKVFKVAREQRPGEELSWRAEPLASAHREHVATHLATILEGTKGLSPFAFKACLLNGWTPGT